jgi:hypothetical protein
VIFCVVLKMFELSGELLIVVNVKVFTVSGDMELSGELLIIANFKLFTVPGRFQTTKID